MHTFPEGEFFIALRESDLVLDVASASQEPGANIILWPKKDSDNLNQKWTWDRESKLLRNINSGQCLSFIAMEPNSAARQDTPCGDDVQRVEYYDYTISSHADEDLVLGAPSKEDGAVVALVRRDNDDWNQMWEFRY